MSLIIGNYIDNVKCESFLDKETNRIRVRSVTDYKKLKLDSLNYRNIKEFIFDDFADLK